MNEATSNKTECICAKVEGPNRLGNAVAVAANGVSKLARRVPHSILDTHTSAHRKTALSMPRKHIRSVQAVDK
jgi:hypothetical protein